MKKIITFAIIISSCAVSQAQLKGDAICYLNWNFGPVISNHFVSNFSVAGGNAGYSYFIKDNLALGAELGWNNYNEYAARQTYITKNGAVTTDMYKYIFAMPVTATVTKYFKMGSFISPYTKLGVGFLYSQQNLYYNIYETQASNWGFAIVPEVGASFKLNPANNWALNAGVQYKLSTNKNSDYNISNLQTYNFSLGATWRIH